jgi:molecular chaperone DnaK
MISDLVEVPAELARELLAEAGLGPDDLDAVVMLGGSSRVPVIQDRIEALIGRVPETELSNRQLDDDFGLRGLALEARRRARRRPETRVVELAPHGVWLRSAGGPAKSLIARGTVLPASASVKLAVDTSVGLGWNDAHELWQSGEDPGDVDSRISPWARAEQFQPALAFRLSGERSEVEVHVELDIHGCLGVRIDERVRGKEAFLRIERRPGLSERALRRCLAEARERAFQTSLRDHFDAVRRAVQELVRTVEGWLADAKSGLDDLVKTSLFDWNRDAEAVLAHGEIDPMLTALEVFDGLIATLPGKLRDGVSGRASVAALPEPIEAGMIDHAPEDDYTSIDVVPLLTWGMEPEPDSEPEAEPAPDEVIEPEPDSE